MIGLATLAVLIWGINYLKGRNILASSYTVEAYLENASGLENSTPVLLNGVKIGYVREIILRTDRKPAIRCDLSLEKAYPIRKNAMAVIQSADLLGTKAIRIEPGTGNSFLRSGDTIAIASEPDMLSSLQSRMTPILDQVGSLAVSIDSLARKLDRIAGSDELKASLDNLSAVTASVNRSLQPGGSLGRSFGNLASFTEMLAEQEEELAEITVNFRSFSESLNNAQIDRLAENLTEVTGQFEILLRQINSGEGTAGRLIYADSLHMGLQQLITDLDLLVRDLNENPQDYVHFSLFGKSQKKAE